MKNQLPLKYQLPLLVVAALLVAVSCDNQPTDSNNGPGDGEPFSHVRPPGSSALAFLQNDMFDELIVEIQYMPGYRPTDNALEELRGFLTEHSGKSDVIITEPEEVPSGGQDAYTANDIRQLEQEHRRYYTEGSVLASYNLFVDGRHTNENVLGIAYYNTSNAYFGETIHDVSSPALGPSRSNVEGTVLLHEYGHLFGLVDNGIDMQEPHQENGPHCSENSCIMYHAMNTTNFFENLFDGSIPGLDAYCLSDLQAARE